MAKGTKKKVTNDEISSFDIKAISDELVSSLNTQFKQNVDKAAFYLSDPNLGAEVTDWVSTGSDMLDIAISNRKYGGYPVGRITELTGLEASGKSLLAAYALSNTQKKGGIAVYIDTEAAVSRDYLTAIGVDVDKLIYLQLDALEHIFASIDKIISNVRTADKKVPLTIVVDSVMGATTLKESESDWSKDGYATDKAIILSKAMRKLPITVSKQNVCLIFTNQLRTNLGVTFGEKFTTSGGKAIAFSSSVRIRLTDAGKIKAPVNGIDEVVGNTTRAKIIKNRLGPPQKTIDYNIYYKSGIDNYGSWLEILKKFKLATSGISWTFKLEYESSKTGQLIKFTDEIVNPSTGELKKPTDEGFKCKSKDFAAYMELNPSLRNYFYDAICDNFIMDYDIHKDFSIEDIKIDSEFENEES